MAKTPSAGPTNLINRSIRQFDFRALLSGNLPATFYLVILATFLLIQVSSSWIPTRDGAAYLSIAKSLASGNGLRRFGNPHLHFAPGYSILIAPAFLFSDEPFLLISSLHWLFLVAFIWGVYLWSERQLPAHALLLTALCAINVGVLYYFRRTLSEAAFTPLLIWTAVFVDRAADASNRPDTGKFALIAALLAGYLFSIRLAGVTLAIGFALMLIVKAIKREITGTRAAAYASIVLATALGTTVMLVEHDHAMALASGLATSYYDEVVRSETSVDQRILTGILWRVQEIGRLTLPGAFKAYGGWIHPIMLVYVPTFVAFSVGFYDVASRRRSALLYAFPVYFFLYIIWPHDQGARFMTPMVPVLWLSLLAFVAQSRWKVLIHRFSRWLFAACLVTSMAYFGTDRLEARKLIAYWNIADTMSTLLPTPAHISFIRTARSFALNSFGPICAVRFDRRCEEIREGSEHDIRLHIEYVAAFGPAIPPANFVLLSEGQNFTLFKRQRP
jgi:hypothetical protein